MNMHTGLPAFTADELKRFLTEKLDMSDGPFGDHENLFDYGLNSVDLMALVAHLNSRGIKVGFIDMAKDATFSAWVGRLGL